MKLTAKSTAMSEIYSNEQNLQRSLNSSEIYRKLTEVITSELE